MTQEMNMNYLHFIYGTVFGALLLSTSAAHAQSAEDIVISPEVTTRVPIANFGGQFPPKPPGVPTDIHRKVVNLFKRINNAYPDASRQRIFNRIGQELDINPERLFNAYHDSPSLNPPVIDTPQISPRAIDQAIERPNRASRPTVDRRIERIRPVRVARPVSPTRIRPTRVRPSGR